MIRSARQLALAFGLAVASLVSTPAQASQAFPSIIAEEFDMPCVPTCTLCHSTNPGQSTTALQGQLFGRALALTGVIGGNEDSLRKLLVQIKAGTADTMPIGKPDGIPDNYDVDGDGVGAYDELSKGNDPNKPGDARICGPEYGCGAHIAKAPAKNGGAWVLAVTAAALVTFGFRRRRSS
jgi:hypothetical protein